jgi:hypothetical protein
MAMAMESDENSRFTDLFEEPVDRLLLPIQGYEDQSLLSLVEAIKPISEFFKGLEDNVYVALHNCQNPADGLTQEESAAIHLYTMQFRGGPSLYLLLNRALRAEDRDELIPWFPFLKLFLTALHKLPSQNGTVWRGVRDVDLSLKYSTGTKFAWWGVSSSTMKLEVLQSKQFLGKEGQRTLFSIECINGKSTENHSYYKNREKEIILMPGSYFEVIGQLNPAPRLHIIQLKEIPSPIILIKPPFFKSIHIESTPIVNKSNIFSQLISMIMPKRAPSKVSSSEIPLELSMNDLHLFFLTN